MKTTPQDFHDSLELSSSGDDIPFLAIQAADELDELSRKKKSALVAVKKLGDVLKNSFPMTTAGQSKRRFVDSSNVAVFSRAIDKWDPQNQISSTQDLVTHATRIVKRLEGSAKGAKGKRTEYEEMRDFCLALATAAASYRESLEEFKPSYMALR